jgi:ABC-2 type transport system permease protein
MNYFKIWLAGARYSLARTLMFRGDFFIWSMVELLWMGVNLLLVAVIYQHTPSIAGWTEYEMVILVGTGMLVQRLLMGFFWTNLFELGRNVRTGAFDFFLSQPGHPLFMASTRKLDPDGLANSFVALGVVIFAVHKLNLHPSFIDIVAYGLVILAGLAIHYSILVLTMALSFWLTSTSGIEGTYFALTEFSRLPRGAFNGFARLVFVWILPLVVVSNTPSEILLHGFKFSWALSLIGLAILWLTLAIFVFNRGLKRYASASS